MSEIVCTDAIALEDIAYIVRHLRERDRREIFGLRWDDNEDSFVNDVFAVSGPMWRLWRYRDEPVAMSGVVPQRPGVVMAGAFGTEKFHHVMRPMKRFAWNWVIPRLVTAQYHRAEAFALASNADGKFFIRMLGGKQEAYLRKYGRDREDYVLYVWRLDEDVF